MSENCCAGCQRDGENNQAESWCSDCGELVCRTCSKCHKRMSPPHAIVSMDQIKVVSSSVPQLSKFCLHHADNKIVFFCSQHDQVLCDLCKLEQHKNCKEVMSIEKAAKDVRTGTAIDLIEKRLESLSQIAMELKEAKTAKETDLEKTKKRIKTAISETKMKFISQINKIECDLLYELDAKYQECSDETGKIGEAMETENIQVLQKDLTIIKETASEIHLFQTIKYMEDRISAIEKSVTSTLEIEVSTLKYVPNVDLKMVQDQTLLGSIQIVKKFIELPSTKYLYQGGQFGVHGGQGELSLLSSFNTSKLGKRVQIFRGCFTQNQQIVLSSYIEQVLHLCDIDGSNDHTIQLNFTPCYVTSYDKDTAVVSDGNEGIIQLINLSSLKPGKKIKVGEICFGVCCWNSEIWINNASNTLSLFDTTGNCRQKVSPSFNLADICVANEDILYCYDSENDAIYSIEDGNERVLYRGSDLKGPRGIATDGAGFIYVAGCDTNNVHKISSNGKVHEVVLGPDDGINNPWGLSYDIQSRLLMVIHNEGESVSVFKVT